MEYETFSAAFNHNRRTIHHVANLLRNRVDDAPLFSLFLGAGSSVTSGVRAAGRMVEEWRRRLYVSFGQDEPFDKWLGSQDWYQTDEEYSRLFEATYDQPSQRRAFIENEVVDSDPGWGYAYLVGLIEARVVNTVFTTNFDDLVNEACFRFGSEVRPQVCGHDSAVSSIRLTSERPKVIKLHGDFLYDSIKNTSTELQNLEANMRDKFSEFAREYGLLVVGYGGNDQSVMDVLDVLVRSDAYFRNGIYWCVRKGSAPGRRLRQLLRNDRVFWVEIEGFDEFMGFLASNLGVGLPHGITAPMVSGLSRVTHLALDDESATTAQITKARGRLTERLQRAVGALEDHHLVKSGSDLMGPRTLDSVIGGLETYFFSIVKAHSAIEDGRYREAVTLLREIRESDAPIGLMETLFPEVGALLNLGEVEEAKELLSKVPPKGSANSTYFTKLSRFRLYVSDSELALEAADRALELSPGSRGALVNRGVALLQLGRDDEIMSVAEVLCKDREEQRHRAAGFALLGEYEKVLGCIQKAVFQGSCSIGTIASGVEFRPYWHIPHFRDAIARISGVEPPPARYSAHCPMSDAEYALHERVCHLLGEAPSARLPAPAKAEDSEELTATSEVIVLDVDSSEGSASSDSPPLA